MSAQGEEEKKINKKTKDKRTSPTKVLLEGFAGLPDTAWKEVSYEELREVPPGTIVNYVRDSFLSPGERKKLHRSCLENKLNYEEELRKRPKKRKKFRCMVMAPVELKETSGSDSTDQDETAAKSIEVASIARRFKDPSKVKLSDVHRHRWKLRQELKGNPRFYIRIKRAKKPRKSKKQGEEEAAAAEESTTLATVPEEQEEEGEVEMTQA